MNKKHRSILALLTLGPSVILIIICAIFNITSCLKIHICEWINVSFVDFLSTQTIAIMIGYIAILSIYLSLQEVTCCGLTINQIYNLDNKGRYLSFTDRVFISLVLVVDIILSKLNNSMYLEFLIDIVSLVYLLLLFVEKSQFFIHDERTLSVFIKESYEKSWEKELNNEGDYSSYFKWEILNNTPDPFFNSYLSDQAKIEKEISKNKSSEGTSGKNMKSFVALLVKDVSLNLSELSSLQNVATDYNLRNKITIWYSFLLECEEEVKETEEKTITDCHSVKQQDDFYFNVCRYIYSFIDSNQMSFYEKDKAIEPILSSLVSSNYISREQNLLCFSTLMRRAVLMNDNFLFNSIMRAFSSSAVTNDTALLFFYECSYLFFVSKEKYTNIFSTTNPINYLQSNSKDDDGEIIDSWQELFAKFKDAFIVENARETNLDILYVGSSEIFLDCLRLDRKSSWSSDNSFNKDFVFNLYFDLVLFLQSPSYLFALLDHLMEQPDEKYKNIVSNYLYSHLENEALKAKSFNINNDFFSYYYHSEIDYSSIKPCFEFDSLLFKKYWSI
jgi:hypothetical protein